MKNFFFKKYKIIKKPFLQKTNFFEKLSLKKIIYIFPFFFGLTQQYYEKYKTDSFYFISQNVHIKKKEETLNWENFKFFKLKSIDPTNIKKFTAYKNILLINLYKSGDINFFGIIEIKKFSNLKKIQNRNFIIKIEDIFDNSNNLKIMKKSIPTFNFLNKKIFYKNDFIPKKISKISISTKKETFQNFFPETKAIEIKKSIQPNQINKQFNKKNNSILCFNKNIINGKQFVSIKFDNKNILNVKKNSLKQSNYDRIVNKFFFINNIRKLNNSLNSKTLEFNFIDTYSSIKKVDILSILTKKTKIYKTKQIKKRLLSGYNYIDSNQKESLYFVKKKLTNNTNLLKIVLPTNLFLFSDFTNIFFANKFSFLTETKNGFFGTSLKKRENIFISKNKHFSFQKNLKPHLKKFRKIDDFHSEKIEVNIPKQVEFLIKKKESFFKIQTKKNWSNENFFFEKKRDVFYTLLKEPNFLKSQKKFIENWEYASCFSWIFITKFFLTLYILYFLKEVYKDYGRELINYLIEYGKTSQIDFENIKEQYFNEELSFRIIKKTNKKIKHISGIDTLLPDIGEIILTLRNSKQIKKFKKSTPKGILLAGPPGNGKTLLVQAIAGESKIPVIIQSGSLLINTKSQGHKKLKRIFQYAKKISPAIIFIDEIDSLGEKRKNVLTNSLVANKDIEFIYSTKLNLPETLIPKPISNTINFQNNRKTDSFDFTNSKINTIQETKTSDVETNQMKLNILTQFLIEMDGLEKQTNFIVFGATNRLKILDPAFTRPGRFNKIITLETPSKKKRIQILKFYTKTRKIEKNISWNYLGNRTNGFTASEIASIMNESSIQSILKKTTHTIETIEKGIDYITTYSSSKKKNIDNLIKVAYYQAGKPIGLKFLNSKYSSLLIYLNLWERKKNTRHDKVYENLVSKIQTKFELENLLIFFNLGKSTEFLYFYGKKRNSFVTSYNSILGVEDQKIIQYVGFLMINYWYLYSINILLKKDNKLFLKYDFQTQQNLNSLINKTILKTFKTERLNTFNTTSNYQETGLHTNWQNTVSKKFIDMKTSLTDWYRLYIPDPEEKVSNIDWFPPDLYIHENEPLTNFSKKSIINLNNIYKLERDFLFHSLILNSFNLALLNIEKNRELVDYFATNLLRYGIIRDNEIKNKF